MARTFTDGERAWRAGEFYSSATGQKLLEVGPRSNGGGSSGRPNLAERHCAGSEPEIVGQTSCSKRSDRKF